MEVINTEFEDLKIIIPKIFEDSRGYFYESYNKSYFEINQLFYNFIQDNQSESAFGTIRGLHYQIEPFAQAKLVRVLKGRILDVVVDLRNEKSTFGKSFSIVLDEIDRKQLLIPRGFAHGFSVLSEKAVVSYKIDNIYQPDFERGLTFNDDFFKIDWKIKSKDMIVSNKDLKNSSFDPMTVYF